MAMDSDTFYKIISNLQTTPGGMRSAQLTPEEITQVLSGGKSWDEVMAGKKLEGFAPGGMGKSDMAGTVANLGANMAMGPWAAGGMYAAQEFGGDILKGAFGGSSDPLATPYNPTHFKDNPIIRKQMPGFDNLTPEAQARILDTAKLSGYLPAHGGGKVVDGQLQFSEGQGDPSKSIGYRLKPINLPTESSYMDSLPGRRKGLMELTARGPEDLLAAKLDPRLTPEARARAEAFQNGLRQTLSDPKNFINQLTSDPSATQQLNQAAGMPKVPAGTNIDPGFQLPANSPIPVTRPTPVSRSPGGFVTPGVHNFKNPEDLKAAGFTTLPGKGHVFTDTKQFNSALDKILTGGKRR